MFSIICNFFILSTNYFLEFISPCFGVSLGAVLFLANHLQDLIYLSMKIIHSVLTTEACGIPRLCLALAVPVLVPSSTLEILDRLSVACMQHLCTSPGRSAVALALGLRERPAFIAFLAGKICGSGWVMHSNDAATGTKSLSFNQGWLRCCGEQTLRIDLLICAQGFRAISMPVARHSCTDLLNTVPS